MVRLLIFALLLGYLHSPVVEPNHESKAPDTKTVDMHRCFTTKSICYVGEDCLYEPTDRGHGKITRLTNSGAWRKKAIQRVEECDVAAILMYGMYPLLKIETVFVSWAEYRTNTNHSHLPILLKNHRSLLRLDLFNGELRCEPGCVWNKKETINYPDYIYSNGSLQFVQEKKRANLAKCFETNEKELKCYVSNTCLAKEFVRHNSIVPFSDSKRKINNRFARNTIEFCDIGATFDSTTGDFGETGTTVLSQGKVSKENQSTFSEYHTNTPKSKVSLAVDYGNAMRVLSISDVELSCTPDCTYHPLMMMEYNVKPHSGHIFWSGKLSGRIYPIIDTKVERRANLSRCFVDEQLICYYGDVCIGGKKGDLHKNIRPLTSTEQNFLKYAQKEREELAKCDVAGIFDYKNASERAFEFHTTTASLDLRLSYNTKEIWAENEEESSRTNRIENPRNLYWKGVIWIKKAVVSKESDTTQIRTNTGPNPNSQKRGNQDKYNTRKKEDFADDKKDSLSYLGLVLIISGCAVVLGIIVAIVVGTIMQRRHNAKNKRKHAAIQQAAAKAAKQSGSNLSNNDERRTAAASISKPINIEKTPLIEPKLHPDDEPKSEETTSTKFSGTVEKENSARS